MIELLLGTLTKLTGFFPILVVGYIYYRIWQRNDRRGRRFDGRGREVKRTLTARVPGATLDGKAAIIAKAGMGRDAPTSLDRTLLRPTVGVRAISLGLTAFFIYIVYFNPQDMLPLTGNIRVGFVALLAYAGFQTVTYEAAYDRDTIVARGWMFQRIERRWTDLVEIRDNGHYLYVLKFREGSKVEMPKYLVGMDTFLDLAQDRIEENCAQTCPNSPKSRPFAVA